jgi:hypothetical protein
MRRSMGSAVRALAPVLVATIWAWLGTSCGGGGSQGPALQAIAFAPPIGTFVVVGESDSASTSTDGQNWTANPTGFAGPLNGVAWGTGPLGGRFVAVGGGGTILASETGSSWIAIGSPTGLGLAAVAFGGATPATSTFVAVGDGGVILTSPTGIEWSESPSPTGANLNGVAWTNDRFLAAGDSGTLLSSADGATWTVVDLGGIVEDLSLNAAAFLSIPGSNGATPTYLVVGDAGTILTSENAVDWAGNTTGLDFDLNAVTAANGIFVIAGDEGTILTSTDGASFFGRNAGTKQFLRGAAFGTGASGTSSLYVAVGTSSDSVVSVDAVTWVRRKV